MLKALLRTVLIRIILCSFPFHTITQAFRLRATLPVAEFAVATKIGPAVTPWRRPCVPSCQSQWLIVLDIPCKGAQFVR